MSRSLILIGAGSCIGGISRYLVQQYVQNHYPSSIPLGTLLVNLSGCFCIGIIYALAEKGNLLTPPMRLFLATGLCGGYTTFSSFAYENVRMMQNSEFYYTALYLLLSVVLGLTATYLGISFIKLI